MNNLKNKILTILAIAIWAGTAHALPQGADVAAGNSTISQPDAGTMHINQTTDKAIINWQAYGINANEAVKYFQPGSGSISLNRVTGADPSLIYGQLSANGQVWVINPNGLLIGPNANINVGGFLGSTLNITDQNFLSGNYTFSRASTSLSSITNQGNISANNGGYAVLISPSVANQGNITANSGAIGLASGDDVTLAFANNQLINLVINKEAAADSLGIDNSGTITADGGQVIISAKAAGDILKTVVNNTGIIQARTIENKNGVIKLLGSMDNNTVQVGGTLDASAPNGGDGGFIETSAHNVELNNPTVTAAAPYGKGGEWLIDPTDITIDAAAASTYSATLNSTDVTITTSAAGTEPGNITVASNISKTSGTARTLTLQAHNNIIVDSGVSISSTSSALNVVFNADRDANGAGNIVMNTGSSITTNGGNITFGGGADPSTTAGIGSGTSSWADKAGIYLNGATLDAGAGNISLHGTAIAGTVEGYGILAMGGSKIQTTSGTITLFGTGGAGTTRNYGVYLYGPNTNVSSTTGAISITGQGAGTGSWNYGVRMDSGVAVTTTSGIITLTGTGGAGTDYNYGVYLSRSASVDTNVSSTTGAISITGQGAGTGSWNYGIYLANGAAVTSTDSAQITLDGRGAGADPAAGIITSTTGANNTIGGVSSTGAITLTANTAAGVDSISLSGLTIQGTGNLVLQPVNAATAIGIAGGAGTFNLSSAELALISDFNSITIGRADGTGAITFGDGAGAGTGYTFNANTIISGSSSNISITDPFNTGLFNLTLNTGGAVTQTAAISAAGLELLGTGGTYTLTNTSNAITTLAGNTGSVNLVENSGFAIGTVNTAGLTTSGNTTLSTTGTVTQTTATTAAGLELLGTGGTYALTNTSNAITTLAGNTGTVSYLDSDALTIGSVGSTNGITATGTVSVATRNGDLTLSRNISTTDMTASAVILNAGKDTAAGTSTGGNIIISGSPTITTGGGGRATLYSGNVSDSAGLTSLIGSSTGRFRYNSDETTTNFTTALGSGNYAIYREQPTVTVTANNDAKTYNGLAYSGGNGVTYSGFVNGDTPAVLSGTPLYGGTSQGAINAGAYTIIPSGLANGLGYNLSYTNGALTVNPALLTVTANNSSKTYDGLSYSGGNGVSYVGFVNGETSAVLGGALGYSGNSQGAINAGSYTITPGGQTSGNYAISYTDGSLTVNPALLTVTANNASKTYDGLSYSGGNGVSYVGFVNGETSAVLGGALGYSGNSQGAINAGSYTITPGGQTSGNYAISYTDGSLTVNPALLTVTANNASKTYGTLTTFIGSEFTPSGLQNGEIIGSVTLTSAGAPATAGVSGSPYTIIPSSATGGTFNAGNYNIIYANGALTVTPASLIITADDKAKIYGDANPVLTATALGLKNGDTNAIISGLTTTAVLGSNVGSYTIDATGAGAGSNYIITATTNGTLTVTPASLTITADDKTRIYGDINPALTASYSGFKNVDTSAVVSGLVLATPATTASSVGTYAITASGATASNYTITQKNGVLTVTSPPNYDYVIQEGSSSINKYAPQTENRFEGVVVITSEFPYTSKQTNLQPLVISYKPSKACLAIGDGKYPMIVDVECK